MRERTDLTDSTSSSPVPWTHSTLRGVCECVCAAALVCVCPENLVVALSHVKFAGESSDLIGREVGVVMEYNERGFPLAAHLVELVQLNWRIV